MTTQITTVHLKVQVKSLLTQIFAIHSCKLAAIDGIRFCLCLCHLNDLRDLLPVALALHAELIHCNGTICVFLFSQNGRKIIRKLKSIVRFF